MSTKPIPYPAETKAKGWRFELDLERVMQSDTWALATTDMRPWLLMLWTTAWQQNPCGSMPSDDALLAARLGMAPKAFAKAKAVLMRGWWLAEDGRLYHDTIVERVNEMLGYKAKEKARKAAYRERMSGNVPRDNHGTTTEDPRDSGGIDATGTGTGTGTSISKEEKGGYTPCASPRPTPAEVTQAMRKSGLADVNPSHPKLVALLEAGITQAELVQAAVSAVKLQKPFAYALATAEGRRRDAAKVTQLPAATATNRQVALEQRNRQVASEWAAQGVTHDAE